MVCIHIIYIHISLFYIIRLLIALSFNSLFLIKWLLLKSRFCIKNTLVYILIKTRRWCSIRITFFLNCFHFLLGFVSFLISGITAIGQFFRNVTVATFFTVFTSDDDFVLFWVIILVLDSILIEGLSFASELKLIFWVEFICVIEIGVVIFFSFRRMVRRESWTKSASLMLNL